MKRYLKYLLQLILAPSEGWADISHSDPDPAELTRRGFYPLLVVVAFSQLLGLLYNKGYTWETVIVRGIIDLGTYFVSLLLARVVFEMFSRRKAAENGIIIPDGERALDRKDAVVIVCALGIMLLIQLLENCLQANLVIIGFLPVYIVLVLYKASAYVAKDETSAWQYTVVASLATVAVPIVLHWLLSLILL